MTPTRLYQENNDVPTPSKIVLILTSEHRKRRLEALMINVVHAKSIYIKNEFLLAKKLQEHTVSCILIDWENVPWLKSLQIHHLKNMFPHIRWIALLEENGIETAWECGRLQIDKVIPLSDTDTILTEINNYLQAESLQVTFADIAIDKDNPTYSVNLKQTLFFIEQYYVQIKSIKYLANCLGVSECVLTREFQASDLDSPKKVLMQLKMSHAVKLLETTNLNYTNISRLAGFSNSKIMAQYFKREWNVSPSEYRSRHVARINSGA